MDAFPRSVVVPVGRPFHEREPHLVELLQEEVPLIHVVFDLECRLAVPDDAVRRRLAVLLLKEDAIGDDLEDVREQGAAGDPSRLQFDGDVMVPFHDDRIGSAREAVPLRDEQLRSFLRRIDVHDVASDVVSGAGRPGDLEGADRTVEEHGCADQPGEGDRLEPLRKGVVVDALQGDGRGGDEGGGHGEAQDDPLREELLRGGRNPVRDEQEVYRGEEPDQRDGAEDLRRLDRGGNESQPDRRDDGRGDREVQDARFGFPGPSLMSLDPLQVRGRGCVALLARPELLAFLGG